MERIPQRRPRADDASDRAAASIKEMERRGLIERSTLDDDTVLDGFDGHEPDYRASNVNSSTNSGASERAPKPFKLR